MNNYLKEMLVRVQNDLPCSIIHITHTDNDGYMCDVVNRFFTRGYSNVTITTTHVQDVTELRKCLDYPRDSEPTGLSRHLYMESAKVIGGCDVPLYILITDISNVDMGVIEDMYKCMVWLHEDVRDIVSETLDPDIPYPYVESTLRCGVKVIVIDHHQSSEVYMNRIHQYNSETEHRLYRLPVEYILNTESAACKLMYDLYIEMFTNIDDRYKNRHYLRELVWAVSEHDIGNIELLSNPEIVANQHTNYGLRMAMNCIFNIHVDSNDLSHYTDDVLDLIAYAEMVDKRRNLNTPCGDSDHLYYMRTLLFDVFNKFPYKNSVDLEFTKIWKSYHRFEDQIVDMVDLGKSINDNHRAIYQGLLNLVPEELVPYTKVYLDDPDQPLQYFSLISKSYMDQHCAHTRFIIAFFYDWCSVSLRMLEEPNKDSPNCATIAAKYGGGGHPCAAGFSMCALGIGLQYPGPVKLDKANETTHIEQLGMHRDDGNT